MWAVMARQPGKHLITETITWQPVDPNALPEGKPNFLLFVPGETGAFEGFLDGRDESGEPIWRDVTAWRIRGVTHYAAMVKGPMPSSGPHAALRDGSSVDLGARWSMPS